MRRLFIIAFAALAACAESEQVTETSENVEVNIGLSGDGAGLNGADESAASAEQAAPAQAAPGQWFTKTGPEGPWAGYGPPRSEAAFSVRCEGGRLIFSTTEMPPSGTGTTTMRLTAPGVDESLAADASGQGLPSTEASVPAGEPWLNQLVSASGNLTVRVGGGGPLVVPVSEPLTSLIRDCGR